MRILRGHKWLATTVAYAPDSRTLISAGANEVRLWDLATGEQTATWPGFIEGVEALDFTPDGKTLALCSCRGTIELRNFPSGMVRQRYEPQAAGFVIGRPPDIPPEGRPQPLYHAAYHPGRRLAAGFYCIGSRPHPRHVLLWRLDIPPPSRQYLWSHGENFAQQLLLALSPAGRHVASGAWDATVIVGDTSTAQPLRTWNAGGRVTALLFRDERTVLAGVGFSVLAYDFVAGRVLWKLSGPRKRFLALALSPDGRTLVTARQDRSVTVWNVETRRPVFSFEFLVWWEAYHGVAVAPDGCTAAVAGQDGSIAVFDLP
jgi:WD40 repeat protein